MTAVLVVVVVLAVAGAGLLVRRARRPRARYEGKGRILVPFSSALEPTVLNAAIRIARAQESTLVAAYLLVVPLQYPEDAPRRDQVAVAVPLLEAVELAASARGRAGGRQDREGTVADTCPAPAVGGRELRADRRAGLGLQPEGARVDPHQRPGRDDRPAAGTGSRRLTL